MKHLVLMLFAAAWLLAFSNNALACACCAEPGTYMIYTGKPSEHVHGILDSMKFDRETDLYMTEAGFDMIKGIEDVRKEMESDSWNYETSALGLVNEFTNKTWKFTIKTPGGKTGTLALPMPAQMVQFKVDIHDTEDVGLGVQLYKEFRFKGYVQNGTGIFRSSIIKPTTYFLVFQGRGNGCDDVADFTHWHLEIDGKKGRYEFNGKLAAAAQ
ncbi:MAG TPA: hypothetical protein VIL74_16325 [Pyrinomonadaceae bacterium]|jgi:hypothetical protein